MEGISRVKSRKFAMKIVRLYQFLCKDRNEFVLSKQLLRSGTGIGANSVNGSVGYRYDF